MEYQSKGRTGCPAPVTPISFSLPLTLGGVCAMGLLVVAGNAAAATDLKARMDDCTKLVNAAARLKCFDELAAEQAPSPVIAAKKKSQLKDSRLSMAPAKEPASQPLSATAEPGDSLPMMAAPPEAAADENLTDSAKRQVLGVRLYKPNYLLPVTYNDSLNKNTPHEDAIEFLGNKFDHFEVKFQLSFEVPLWTNILRRDLDVYFAYTQIAFFQAYNREYSSPFRDTNYEPELGLHWDPHWQFRQLKISSIRAAVDHQSNGRSEPLSRSWNRMTGQVEAEYGDFDFALRFWAPLEAKPSDNPDIYNYMGYGEFHAAYQWGNHRFGAMIRNPSQPAFQLDWSYPLGDVVSLYIQYFNGYGESMLDYNHSVNRIGVGFRVNDWP